MKCNESASTNELLAASDMEKNQERSKRHYQIEVVDVALLRIIQHENTLFSKWSSPCLTP